jgi:hypothetical protein
MSAGIRTSTVLIALSVVGSGGYVSYELVQRHAATPVLQDTPTAHATPRFPVERVLTDRNGRTVAVRLLARSATEVQFMRSSDGRSFQYAIASLSDSDQAFLWNFPVTTLAALPVQPVNNKTGTMSLAEGHLRRERGELEHQIALLRLELQKCDDKSPTLSRDQLERRISAHRNRIVDIDKGLLEIAFQARH